jgi:hypothetical protein
MRISLALELEGRYSITDVFDDFLRDFFTFFESSQVSFHLENFFL